MLKARCYVALNEPMAVLDRLCSYFDEHGTTERWGRRGRISIVYGSAALEASPDGLTMAIEASDETDLAYVKMGLVHHLREFSRPQTPRVRWNGDGGVGLPPPFFREMTVVGASDLTPSMRRVVLKGRNLARFAAGGLHVRLILAPDGGPPVWPVIGEDGCPTWPGGDDAPAIRFYTIRRLDLDRGEMTIDILRHDGDATPGSRFATGAKPGDVVGLTGPSGDAIPAARSLILLGDETAIPAIARILEALPGEARATAYIEVADEREEQALSSAARTRIEWLHRNAGAPSLSSTFKVLDPAAFSGDTFVWAGCEFADFKAIRRHCRATLGLARERHFVVAYWRRGAAGDTARRET